MSDDISYTMKVTQNSYGDWIAVVTIDKDDETVEFTEQKASHQSLLKYVRTRVSQELFAPDNTMDNTNI